MSWFSNLFSGKSQVGNYSGIRPYSDIRDVPAGGTLVDVLTQRMQGQGVGIPEEFYTRATSPVIAQRMARYNQYERPEMEAEFSSRGINYSPLVGDIMSRRRGDLERDIQEYLGQTALQAQLQRQEDIKHALGLGLPTVQTGANIRSGAADFDRGIWNTQEGARVQAQQQAGQNLMNAITAIPLTAANIYSAATMPDTSKYLKDILTEPGSGTYKPARTAFSSYQPTQSRYNIWGY